MAREAGYSVARGPHERRPLASVDYVLARQGMCFKRDHHYKDYYLKLSTLLTIEHLVAELRLPRMNSIPEIVCGFEPAKHAKKEFKRLSSEWTKCHAMMWDL